MYKLLLTIFFVFFFFVYFISSFFIPVIKLKQQSIFNSVSDVYSSEDFLWPIPGYKSISSYFGKRISPTSGASSYHSGIDIPAPEGTQIYAIAEGTVIFSSWGAGGGYTITIKLDNKSNNPNLQNLSVSYCHLSPIMYVNYNNHVEKGALIGTVGPKIVYGINNNPYHDEYGNPTNGATTGCHLHFAIKKDDSFVDPFNYYLIE